MPSCPGFCNNDHICNFSGVVREEVVRSVLQDVREEVVSSALQGVREEVVNGVLLGVREDIVYRSEMFDFLEDS